MKVKISKIVLFIFFIDVAIALSLFKILGSAFPILNFDYFNRYVIIFTSILSSLAVFCGFKKIPWSLKLEVAYLLIIFWVRIFLDFLGDRNVYKEINAYSCYMYIIVAIPLFYVLQHKTISIEELVDHLLKLAFVSYGLRSLISIVYSFTQKRIFASIQTESAVEDWFRNGILRVNPPFLGMIIIALCVYRIATVKKHKWLYYSEIIIAILYSGFVHCSRALLLYQVIELIFLIMYMKKSTVKQFVLFFVLSITSIVLIRSGIFDVYVTRIFSTTDTVYWFSNQARLYSYPYYFSMFLNNFWTGTGFLLEDEVYFRNGIITGGLGDNGVLRTAVQLGILGVLFYTYIILRVIKIGMKLKRHGNGELSLLFVGMGISMVLTSINIDMFYPVFAMSVPIIVAIAEYSNYSMNQARNVKSKNF